MFKLTFLPATMGDAIWIAYGDPASPHHVLVDGGTEGTRRHIGRKLQSPEYSGKLDLAVVSHVDRDHIGGILTLMERSEHELRFDDFWFNSFDHLPEPEQRDESLGPVQGERLGRLLDSEQMPWNMAFEGEAVMVPDDGELPTVTLRGGMQLTLLTPSREALVRLRPEWETKVREAGLIPGGRPERGEVDEGEERLGVVRPSDIDVEELANSEFEGDKSVANGSSIAFLAEFEGRRALLAADAHVTDLLSALERFSPGRPLQVDLFKISHHGSQGTTSLPLVEKVHCPRYVFSTSGASHQHPDAEAVSRVIIGAEPAPELIFNYRTMINAVWGSAELKSRHGYSTVFPAPGTEGIDVEP